MKIKTTQNKGNHIIGREDNDHYFQTNKEEKQKDEKIPSGTNKKITKVKRENNEANDDIDIIHHVTNDLIIQK